MAAQRAITEIRKSIQIHVIKLPTSYFDNTKSGVLISRIMSDADGIRNLVGTGLVRMVGGLFTAVIGLGYTYSKDPIRRWVMRLWAPWVRWVFGAAFDRDTERYIPEAGLKLVETRFLYQDIIKMIVARPEPSARPELHTEHRQ